MLKLLQFELSTFEKLDGINELKKSLQLETLRELWRQKLNAFETPEIRYLETIAWAYSLKGTGATCRF